MDKKKTFKERKKNSFRKATLVKLQKDRNSLTFLNELTDQGLNKLFLSPLTQKVLECRIGENITTDNRWVFVKKEKIEDNMFLHDYSSEFLPIRKRVEIYPESEMLIGSYSHIQDTETDFFLCTTVDVKDDILLVIETEKKTAYDRVWNLLHPLPRRWRDLGSQIEVDDSLNKRNRSQFEITIGSEYPIPQHRSIFTMCFAQNIRNSYVEILSGRFVYNLIYRKRVDASTQSTLPSINKCLQSKVSYSSNKYVQYSYNNLDGFEMNEQALERIRMFILNKCDKLYETLVVNFNINLFNDDYKDLSINDKGQTFRNPVELRSYQDVLNCKHKKVSCVSWNALVSGMLAVAYTVTPIYYVGKHMPVHNDAENTVYEKHFVLVWEYKNNVRPQLYMHAYREVTALNFCPYDKNILVAGYSNGQIVVWDIKNRIAAVEMREILTHIQEKHRAIMLKHTEWIKPALGVQNVFPTVTSLFDDSHRSAVTSIVWIPPCHYLSKLGNYEKTQPNNEHMQFFTVALSGSTVQVWDLKPEKHHLEKKTAKKRTQRLSKVPAALTQTESPLKKLQKSFIPHYRLVLRDPSLGCKKPLTNIVANNRMYAYEALNPETLEDMEKRTHFRLLGLLHPFNNANQLILTSTLGTLSIVKWDGTDYNQGLNINTETCTERSNFAHVHDGPITACEINPLLPEVLLTIGGSVFAIWECDILNVPLVWRKSHSRYISGMWSFRHPLTVFMTRSDSQFEIWNFLEKSEGPVRTFRHKGNQLVSVFNDSYRLHSRKETFITTDLSGAVKIFHLPTGIVNITECVKEESVAYLRYMVTIKKGTDELKLKVKRKQATATVSDKRDMETLVTQPVVLEPKVVKIGSHALVEKVVPTAVNKWQKRLETHMHNTLMEKKNLNIDEIERNRIPMQEILHYEKKKEKEINKKMMTREEDFKKIKESLIVPVTDSRKIRRKITIALSKEMVKILKQTYYEDFKNIEAETLQEIKSNRFKFNLNWTEMLQFGICRKLTT